MPHAPFRPRTLLAAALAVVAVAASSAPAVADDEPRTTVVLGPETRIGVEVVGAAAVDEVALAKEVAASLDAYFRNAVLEGLATGAPSVDVADRFSPDGASRLATEDRPILVEEGTPRPSVVVTDQSDARLTVLVGASGVPEVVVAQITHRAAAIGGSVGTLRVGRFGSLVLVPVDGQWKIDSYHVKVERREDPLPPLADLWVLGGGA